MNRDEAGSWAAEHSECVNVRGAGAGGAVNREHRIMLLIGTPVLFSTYIRWTPVAWQRVYDGNCNAESKFDRFSESYGFEWFNCDQQLTCKNDLTSVIRIHWHWKRASFCFLLFLFFLLQSCWFSFSVNTERFARINKSTFVRHHKRTVLVFVGDVEI